MEGNKEIEFDSPRIRSASGKVTAELRYTGQQVIGVGRPSTSGKEVSHRLVP